MLITILRILVGLVGVVGLGVSVEMLLSNTIPLMQHASTVMQFFLPIVGNTFCFVISLSLLYAAFSKKTF